MSPIAKQIQAAVSAASLSRVARDLGVNHHTLASYLAGCAREGSTLLIEKRWQERPAQSERAR